MAVLPLFPSVQLTPGFASSRGLTAMDRRHFDAKSVKVLGQRYAEAMVEIQGAGKRE